MSGVNWKAFRTTRTQAWEVAIRIVTSDSCVKLRQSSFQRALTVRLWSK